MNPPMPIKKNKRKAPAPKSAPRLPSSIRRNNHQAARHIIFRRCVITSISIMFALVGVAGAVWTTVEYMTAAKLKGKLENHASCGIGSGDVVALPGQPWSAVLATACRVNLTVGGRALDAAFTDDSGTDGLTKVTFEYPRHFPWLSLRSCKDLVAQNSGNFNCTYAPGNPNGWGVFYGSSAGISSLSLALARVSETGLLSFAWLVALAWTVVYVLVVLGMRLWERECADARSMLQPAVEQDTAILGYDPLAEGPSSALLLA